MNAYTLSAVQVGSTVLPVTDHSVAYGVEDFRDGHSGLVTPTFSGVLITRPVATLNTRALATALALCGVSGLSISTSNKVYLYHGKMADGSGRESGSVHRRRTVTNGLMLPMRVSGASNQKITITFEVHAFGDGTNNPVAFDQAALPTVAASTEEFVGGPVKVNGTLYECDRWDVDFGWQLYKHEHSGVAYPTGIAVMSRMPTVTITTRDVSLADGLGNWGTAITALYCFAKKLSSTGGRVANATASHVSFGATRGCGVPSSEQATHGTPGSVTVTIPVAYDGVNDPIALNLATAIS